MQKRIVKIVQVGSIPFFSLLSAITVNRRKISLGLEDIDTKSNYVIVASHRGMLDPFIIGYGVGPKLVVSVTPLWFFTQNRFFRNPVLHPFLYGYGCFRARHEVGKNSGLNYGIKLIKSGQNLVIFPEGKVSKLDRAILPKTGVEILANLPGIKLIPARVRWNRKRGLLKSYSLSVGKPFSGKNMTAEQIMDVVYSLKFS